MVTGDHGHIENGIVFTIILILLLAGYSSYSGFAWSDLSYVTKALILIALLVSILVGKIFDSEMRWPKLNIDSKSDEKGTPESDKR